MDVVNRQGGQSNQGDADVVVFETAARTHDQDRDRDWGQRQLVLYIVSLFGVRHSSGKEISGDALIVRPRGTSDQALLAAILGCTVEEIGPLLAGTGTWLVREVDEIDGHRLRFEPN